MPYPRKTPLVSDEIYHIFNKGIDGRVTFEDESDYYRACKIMRYYMFSSPPVRLSTFLDLTPEAQLLLSEADYGEEMVSIICYCFMPNHFHFILKQLVENGISRFISQFLNSYTRYFNTKNKRVGQLFLDRFKNVLVENDPQMMHLSRYVHLNPYSSGVVNNLEQLEEYKWSSFREYLNKVNDPICDKEIVLSNFVIKNSYEKFVLERADYQRELKRIENLILE
jgi:putative transposase